MKSLIASVLWPAWDVYSDKPANRFLFASYGASLVARAARQREVPDGD